MRIGNCSLIPFAGACGKLDAGWPESEEEQVRKFQVGRRSDEDNQIKPIRHQNIQTDAPRHREKDTQIQPKIYRRKDL